ncbi:MAG TPA: ATP-binding cassette domain-containing protein [Vicinamibacterales bacterium]|nr:ATP-binding cassette domain-containing protein [Vicinamibacterales bacterium]
MHVLNLEEVSRRFGDFVAVNDLSFSIEGGQLVGFLGANGAGKTTTLRMILDILRPTSGRIDVLGGPAGREHASEVGFLPEERGLYRGMTALETVIYFGRLKGLSRSAARHAAGPLLARFGLGPFANRAIDLLSKGTAQKVQLATALINSPKLLLLDEPFSGLDPVNQTVLQDEILAAARNGATVLFSTHVMEHAERLCTRLIMLNRGRMVFDGDLEQAKAMLPVSVRLRAKANPSSLPGVASVEQLPTGADIENGWTDWQVILEAGGEPGDLLEACVARDFTLREFVAHSATLHDVFMHLAGPPAGEQL